MRPRTARTTPEDPSRRRVLRLGGAAAVVAATAAGPALPAAARPASASAAPPFLSPPAASHGGAVALEWFDLASALVRATPGFSPPVASRAFAYAGVALYEAVVAGMPEHRSLAGQLAGLARPPAGRVPVGHWPLVANAALAGVLRRLFPTASAEHLAAVDRLEGRWANQLAGAVPPVLARWSHWRGEAVAEAVFAWSAGDGGHEGYLRNVSPSYVPPAGPGLWAPTPPGFAPALQPTWGSNRTFVPGVVDASAPAPPTPYSEDPSSRFFAEAFEVYDAVNRLTPGQAEVVRFWADAPGETATPAGHSVSILTQVLRARGADLAVAAEAYAKLGVAVADAFVCCWATKYRYDLLRPVTYVRARIDPAWGDPLPVDTPPFPEYTSGHSVQSGAAARVLTGLFGPVGFTDHTHDARGLAPRTFSSFDHAAVEAAVSRLFGGIHFRPAIEEGLRQGARVGEAVDALAFGRREAGSSRRPRPAGAARLAP